MGVRFRSIVTLAAGVALLVAEGHGAGGQVVFHERARQAGIDVVHVNGASVEKYFVEIMGSGGLFADLDNDGWIDVLLVDGGSLHDPAVARRARHRLFRNRGDGTFEDVTARSGIVHREYGMGACAADIDNDGWVDVYITNVGPNVLYRNNGDGTFSDVSRAAGVADSRWGASCAFGDVDRDGFVDLVVINYVDASRENNPYCGHTRPQVRMYCHPLNFEPLSSVLYRNRGDGTFEDVSDAAGIGAQRSNGLGVVMTDVDGDGWLDIFVANDGEPDFLYRNLGGARFEEVGLLAGVALGGDGRPRAGMGTDAGDSTGSGRFDLVVTNLDREMHSVFRNLGDLVFRDATLESGVGAVTRPYVGFGVALFDADHDGHLDLAIANGNVNDVAPRLEAGGMHAQPNLLLRNDGRGRFTDVTATAGPGFALRYVSRLLAAGDVDNDGDLDLLITNNGGPAQLLVNEGGTRGNAVLVRTIGTTSNRDGIGARLLLSAAGRTQVREVRAGSSYLGQHDTRVHFGLGAAAPDRLEIRWPSGHTDIVPAPPVNHVLTVREGEGLVSQTPFHAGRR